MKVTKKLLSVLLAVIMIMTSMSVCFAPIGFAASGTVTADQWNALYDALKADSVKNATFTTVDGKYTVDDPDGDVLAAVQAYFNVFDTLANKTPTTGNPNNTSNSTGSTEDNRVIQQVNANIKNYVAANMPGYEASMGTFIANILGTASVSTATGSTQTKGGSNDTSNDKSVPSSNLSAVSGISLTVVSGSAVTGYTLDNLPESVVTEKTFTVNHANDRYDYTYATGSTGGCNSKTTYTRTYKYYYYITGKVVVTNGSAVSTSVIKETATTLEDNSAYFSYTLDQFVEAGFDDVSVISSIKNTLVDAKNAVVNAFSGSVYSHFFSAYNVEALSALVDKAVNIITASGLAMDLNDYIAAGYADIITDRGALETLANNIKTVADKYDAYASDVKAYVESHEYEGETFSRQALTDFYNSILIEIDLIDLRVLKKEIEDTSLPYFGYNDDNVTDGEVLEDGTIVNSTVDSTSLGFAWGDVDGWLDSLGTYDDELIAIVWGETDIEDILSTLLAELDRLIIVAGHNLDFAREYSKYVTEVYSRTNLDADSEELYAALSGYDSWYSGLKNLVAEIETEHGKELAAKVIDNLDAAMKAHMDSKYNALHARVLAQIDLAFELYNELIGNTRAVVQTTILNVGTYTAFEKALGHVEIEVYDFLYATPNFDMPQETIDKYNAIWDLALEDYHNFITSGGFDRYAQTEISNIVRPEEKTDNHDAHIGGYEVTDEKVEKIIEIIDKLLNDEDIKDILGGLINKDEETGEPTGEPFDLAALLNKTIDGLFTDDLLNTIMSFLYPAVTKEFAKVWAGLPESITVEDVDTGILGIKADVTAYLDLYTVEKATHAVGMSIFPVELAERLRSDYPQYEAAAAVLDDSTIAAVYHLNGDGDEDDEYINPWDDEKLYVSETNEETGEVTKKLNLTWGIDEADNKREAFVDAAVAALSGLEPLLLALLSNQAYDKTNKIGTGEGSAQVIISLSLKVDPIDLRFMVSNSDGYNNLVAPIFEVFGITAPDGGTLTSIRKVLEDGLLTPLNALLNKLSANPLDTILSALPNLMYALSADRILPLLELLAIDISYTTNATYSVIGLINGSMNDVYKSEEPINFKVSDMINLEDMGLDLSFGGIWSMVTGALGENVTLPQLDAGYVATLGELTWKDTNRSAWTYTPLVEGKAAYIEANKADVLIYLVRYLLNTLGENPDLLASFGLELSEDVNAIISGVTANPDATIAAIVELLNGVQYDTLKEYVWYVSELNEDTVVGLTPAIQQYLAYDNNWTKETATYLVENIDTIITAVMAMVGDEDAEPFNLSATLTELIGSLFTNKNITAIAKLLAKLDLNALLAKEGEAEEDALDINALVAKFANIDLSGFAAYAELADDTNWGFQDGDKEGFKTALVNLLAPLNSVLDFILAGKNLTLLDDVNLIGYNGYDSAIVPLLEALGAENLAPVGDKSGLVATLDAVFATVDAILADPIDGILNVLPSLLYFVKSNGLTTAVRNLLQPVYVILETIDPIYALNLNELIGGLTADLGFTLDLGNLSFEAIFNILDATVALDLSALEEIIDDVCEVIVGKTYTSASSVIGANGKKGTYGEFFDAADLVTVLVSFVLDWAQQGNNANDLIALIAGDDAAKAEEIAGYINGAITVIAGINPTYEAIDWDYNFPAGFDDAIFESGIQIQPTINTIKYPTNWTEDTAKYVAENLDEIVDEVIGLVDENYTSLADFIADKVTIYSAANVDAIVAAVAGLLVDIDETLVKTVGLVLGANIDALKAYKADEGIDTAEEFAAALTDVLSTVEPVLNWLLFGEDYAFFSKSGKDLVTIKGAEGYAYGLAPILEALGVAAPSKDEATIANVLDATFARVDEILADPVNKVFELLPNIIYFLNANGVSTSVKNLLSGVTALMGALKEQFGLEVDLMTIFNDLINGLLPEESTVTLDVENLDLESIFNLVQELLGINLAPIADILIDLCVGQIVAYTSASGEYGFKMLYTDDFAKYDMITIIVSCLLQVIKLDENKEAIKEMVGEEAYEGILNVISLNINVPVQDFEWALTESADTDKVFSALQSSELYGEFQYGPFYTKEMEQYISDNFGEFVDNIIYLLGLQINGTTVDNLTDLLSGLVGGSVYNSDMVITIRDAIAGLASTLETSLPAGAHILEILKLAEIADLKAVAEVEVPSFTDDKTLFVMYLCDVLEPIYPVLEWLLADVDLTFFIDEAEEVLITLPGAEGYAYGLIPVLEALDCDGIVTPDSYYSAIENGDKDTVITAIITPILNRVDEILADPAVEILAILPNLIYFINSNGIDTVVKNTLNAVYTLLNAIEPIAKVDLYELIGLDLETLDFEKLFDMALELIAEATGYELTAIHADAIVELTMGKLESYTSVNGKTAYRMVYQEAEAQGEMVTVVLRLAVTFLGLEKNIDSIIGILENNFGMSAETKDYVKGVLTALVACITDTQLGMDQVLATIYYIFYGANIGVGESTNGVKDLNAQWLALLKELGLSENREEATIGNLIADILDLDIFDDILDAEEGIAPNGFIAFFKKIIEWFNKLVEWFRNAFQN